MENIRFWKNFFFERWKVGLFAFRTVLILIWLRRLHLFWEQHLFKTQCLIEEIQYVQDAQPVTEVILVYLESSILECLALLSILLLIFIFVLIRWNRDLCTHDIFVPDWSLNKFNDSV